MTPEKIKPRWVFRGASSEEKVAVPDFFNLNNIPEGTARIMMRRGISTEEKLTHFLYDTLDNLSDPFLMKGMQQAVRRIIQAIDLKEKIVIYGDYDVDGITSTSICVRCLRKLGADVNFYIPLREEEGYLKNGFQVAFVHFFSCVCQFILFSCFYKRYKLCNMDFLRGTR